MKVVNIRCSCGQENIIPINVNASKCVRCGSGYDK